MSRRTLAFPRPAFVFAFLGLASIGFLAHACTEPNEPAIDKDITGPQLAATASCTAPCVEVQVSVKGQGPPQPANGIVVTLWRAGQNGDGVAFHEETLAPDGIAKFEFDAGDFNGPVGFCAVARPLTDKGDAATFVNISSTSGDQLDVLPNAEGVKETSISWQGSVSESANKSTVLNKENLVKNCLSWPNAAKAPFSVDATTAVLVGMEMNEASASISITCRFPDNSGENCQSWTAILLDGVTIPWEADLPFLVPDGVKRGFLASVGKGNSPAVNDGLAFGETYAVEIAQGEYSSSKTITTPEQSGKNQSASISRTAELETILCEVNDGSPDFLESSGEVTTGMDIQPPVIDGYAGEDALKWVQFYADPGKVVIAFDYFDLDGDLTANLQIRARKNPDFPDDLPTNINKTAKYDFGDCPSSHLMSLSENTEDLIIISVACRDDPDPDAPDLRHAEITVDVPAKRLIEWDINTAGGDKHPETAKFNASSALRLIQQPVFLNPDMTRAVCPLDGEFWEAKSNDPKIWGSQID